MPGPLKNPKRETFCREYVLCGNSAEAARQAGYSSRTARTIGSALLTDIDVAERVAELRGVALAKHEVNLDWWVENIKAIAELPRKAKKLSDKVAAAKVAVIAMDQVAQHLGAFKPKKHEITGAGGEPIAAATTVGIVQAVGSVADVAGMSDVELRSMLTPAPSQPPAPTQPSADPTPPTPEPGRQSG